MRISSILKLSHFQLHRKALRISHFSFTAWGLNQQDNNNAILKLNHSVAVNLQLSKNHLDAAAHIKFVEPPHTEHIVAKHSTTLNAQHNIQTITLHRNIQPHITPPTTSTYYCVRDHTKTFPKTKRSAQHPNHYILEHTRAIHQLLERSIRNKN